MSHFPVMIVTKEQPTEEVLERVLAPFDEGTEDERFLKFVALDAHELDCEKKHYQEHYADICSFDEYMKTETYYNFDEETKQYGFTENTNAKWDWWVKGGRWKHFLLLKNAWNADFAQVKCIDFERMIKRQEDFYFEIWEEIINEKLDENDIFRYWGVPTKKEILLEEYESKEDFLLRNGCIVFSYIDIDGNWLESGEMGWFGLRKSKEEQEREYAKKFKSFLENLEDDWWVTIVDCHI